MTKMKQCSMIGGPHDGECYEIPIEWQELVVAEKTRSILITEEENPDAEPPITQYAIPVRKGTNGKFYLDYYSKVERT